MTDLRTDDLSVVPTASPVVPAQPLGGAVPVASVRRTSARKPSPMSRGLTLLTRMSGSPLLDRWNLRRPAERVVFHATKTGLGAASTAARTFSAAGKAGKSGSATRSPSASRGGLFDLTPTDEQQMIVEVVREFATEQVRPAAAAADHDGSTPDALFATAVELGVLQVAVPDTLGGIADQRTTTTGVLVAEALAHGDLGIAVACLAPAAVSTALSLWGTAEQQATYLPAFVGDNPPRAALAMSEPHPLADVTRPRTTATRTEDGYMLRGEKSLVPGAAVGELFIVSATVVVDGAELAPALFVVESGASTLTTRPEPAMGLRPAATGRLILDGVAVPLTARLGTAEDNPFMACVRLSRLAWCALAVGTASAVVDYVIPYVNDRVAFGEPVSHRQGVAFPIADMATELEGMRMVTYRAAARAEQGLDYTRELALARRLCADKGMAIGSDGVQLLGGHGFVMEHPVERWYRDLRAVAVLDGMVLV